MPAKPMNDDPEGSAPSADENGAPVKASGTPAGEATAEAGGTATPARGRPHRTRRSRR